MKRVYASADRAAVELVCDFLYREGIDNRVFNENTASVFGGIPFFHAVPEVWVLRNDDEEAARAIIERFQSGAIREALARDPWICPECGEVIEGQFTQCWRCAEDDPRDGR